MCDIGVYEKAVKRVCKATGRSTMPESEVITFIERENDRYREKIKNLESWVEDLSNKNCELSFDVETGKNHINLLRDRVMFLDAH